MALFDHYVMVDWTGGNGRKTGKPDAIWLAQGDRTDAEPAIVNPASRTDAVDVVRHILTPFAKAGAARRVLVCFDFAYGYPKGFASALPGASPSKTAWKQVWTYLSALVQDDIGTRPGRKPTNESNRFDAADKINQALSPSGGPLGPFWCLFKPGSREFVPQDRPAVPFGTRSGVTLGTRRLTDGRARSDTPFRLFGTGSVGSQVLTGIPCLERLRFDNSLSDVSAVWPFETGWAGGRSWPSDAVRIVHAEIYPSVRRPLDDAIKDRGQVRAMWNWARDVDTQGKLANEFAIPAGIHAGSPDDLAIRQDEGWILGCP